VHKIFTLFKQASYLQYHPEYKKPATKFPTILDSFFNLGSLQLNCIRRASSLVEVGVVGGQGHILNKMNWEGVRVK